MTLPQSDMLDTKLEMRNAESSKPLLNDMKTIAYHCS